MPSASVPGEYGASVLPVPAGTTGFMGMTISSDFVSGIGVGLKGGAELLDRRHPAEKILDVEQRRLLHEVGPRLVRGVVQHHAEIFEEEAIAQGRLDADIGGD